MDTHTRNYTLPEIEKYFDNITNKMDNQTETIKAILNTQCDIRDFGIQKTQSQLINWRPE